MVSHLGKLLYKRGLYARKTASNKALRYSHLTMATSKLFQPIRVGAVNPQHRVVMAPLTRYRGNTKHTPTDLLVEHYAARASIPGTLIISEATFIAHKASGDAFNVPGIWSDEQIAAWKKVHFLLATLSCMCNPDHFLYPGVGRGPRKRIVHILAALVTRTRCIDQATQEGGSFFRICLRRGCSFAKRATT